MLIETALLGDFFWGERYIGGKANGEKYGIRIGKLSTRGMCGGPETAVFGNIIRGGSRPLSLSQDGNAVRKTIEETVHPLLKSGRYLPCLDDRPRSNISFAQYRLFRELLEEIGFKVWYACKKSFLRAIADFAISILRFYRLQQYCKSIM